MIELMDRIAWWGVVCTPAAIGIWFSLAIYVWATR